MRSYVPEIHSPKKEFGGYPYRAISGSYERPRMQIPGGPFLMYRAISLFMGAQSRKPNQYVSRSHNQYIYHDHITSICRKLDPCRRRLLKGPPPWVHVGTIYKLVSCVLAAYLAVRGAVLRPTRTSMAHGGDGVRARQ